MTTLRKAKRAESTPFIVLDTTDPDRPLYRQIYDSIRTAILSGSMPSGTRLPATRQMAQQLSVSRITVVGAFDQLLAEGYLEGRAGSGTFVAANLPEDLLHVPSAGHAVRIDASETDSADLSETAKRVRLSESAVQIPDLGPVPFRNGLTATAEFPFDVWERLAVRRLRNRNRDFGYGESAGYRPLRQAVADHLAAARGVVCDIDQVYITNGAQQALDLIARTLLDPGDEVLIEDPCYQEALGIFKAYGATVSAVPVDESGFDVAAARSAGTRSKLAYVTPSHQFPTGATMTLSRRLQLLEFARERGVWIVEDDYNSEFRYAGRPLASLHNLDAGERVIYVGTFSKTIFPALRLGCLVVPKSLIRTISALRNLADTHSPVFEQTVLADFIAEGHFARHLRRMRTLYEKRQHFLVDEVRRVVGSGIRIERASAGMHLIGWLENGIDADAFVAEAAGSGIHLAPLKNYCVERTMPSGVVLGYTGFNEGEIGAAVIKLRDALIKCGV